MTSNILLFLSLIICVFVCLLAFSLSTLRFALAKLKFQNKACEPEKNSISRKYIIEKSRLSAIVISMATKLLAALLITFIFISIKCIFDMLNIELSLGFDILIFIFSSIIGIFIQYSLAEMPAAYFGNKYPEKTIKLLAKPFLSVLLLLAPIEYLARKLASKLFGEKIEDELDSFDYIDVDIKLRAEENDVSELSAMEESIVKNTMKLPDLDISDIMIPRNQISYINLNDDFENNIKKIKDMRHTRYPLCDGDLDKCIGIIHIRDILSFGILSSNEDFLKIKRSLLKINEDETPAEAFAKFKDNKTHIALVQDEFGGVIGMLTLDGILEIIVGNVRDEFDKQEDIQIRRINQNTYKVSALMPLHELSDELDTDIDSEQASTIGGLMTSILGRFPTKGESIKIPNTDIIIIAESVDRTRILNCIIKIDSKDKENQ